MIKDGLEGDSGLLMFPQRGSGEGYSYVPVKIDAVRFLEGLDRNLAEAVHRQLFAVQDAPDPYAYIAKGLPHMADPLVVKKDISIKSRLVGVSPAVKEQGYEVYTNGYTLDPRQLVVMKYQREGRQGYLFAFFGKDQDESSISRVRRVEEDEKGWQQFDVSSEPVFRQMQQVVDLQRRGEGILESIAIFHIDANKLPFIPNPPGGSRMRWAA